MTNQEKLQICNQILMETQEIATRWIKGIKTVSSGHSNSPSSLSLNFNTKKIEFTINPLSSGLGLAQSISFSYLENSDNIEQDAANSYLEDQKARREMFDYKNKLENDPKVKEYVDYCNKNNYYFPYPGSHDSGLKFLS